MILRIDSALSLDLVHRNRRCAPQANRSKCGSASARISLCWHRSLLKALPLFHSPCMMMMMMMMVMMMMMMTMMTTQRHNMRSTKFLLPGPWLDVKITSDWRTLKKLLASSFWTPHAKGSAMAGKGWSDAHSAELKPWSVVPVTRDNHYKQVIDSFFQLLLVKLALSLHPAFLMPRCHVWQAELGWQMSVQP